MEIVVEGVHLANVVAVRKVALAVYHRRDTARFEVDIQQVVDVDSVWVFDRTRDDDVHSAESRW